VYVRVLGQLDGTTGIKTKGPRDVIDIYILLLTTMTWGHHHHHHCCKPLLTGWMGEDEEMRDRSNNDERRGHP